MILALLACQPTLIDLSEDTSAPTDDTAASSDDTGPTTSDSGGNASSGPWGWTGYRAYDIGERCDGELDEEGLELQENTAHLAAACPDCERFFQLSVSPEEICGLGVASPTWRGLSYPEAGRVGIYAINEGDGGWAASHYADADDGDRVDYAWDGDLGQTTYTAEGWFELVPLEDG